MPAVSRNGGRFLLRGHQNAEYSRVNLLGLLLESKFEELFIVEIYCSLQKVLFCTVGYIII